MSFQQSRLDLAAALETLTEGNGWRVTTETDPDIFHQLIVVNHADLIEPQTFRVFQAELTVTLWVSEADANDAADLLYDLLSPGPDSLVFNLATTAPIAGRNLTARARNVGRRREGPSGFLAGDLEVVLMEVWA